MLVDLSQYLGRKLTVNTDYIFIIEEDTVNYNISMEGGYVISVPTDAIEYEELLALLQPEDSNPAGLDFMSMLGGMGDLGNLDNMGNMDDLNEENSSETDEDIYVKKILSDLKLPIDHYLSVNKFDSDKIEYFNNTYIAVNAENTDIISKFMDAGLLTTNGNDFINSPIDIRENYEEWYTITLSQNDNNLNVLTFEYLGNSDDKNIVIGEEFREIQSCGTGLLKL